MELDLLLGLFPEKLLPFEMWPFDFAQGASWLSEVEASG
jgi:hypothetical protein